MQVTNTSREDIENLDRYIKEVSRGRSHIEAGYEKKLILEYQESKGRRKAQILDELVSYNITILAELALIVINSMRGGQRIDPLDLMQVGILTFIKKLDTWDPSKKAKMITYYYRDVKTQMQRFIMNNAFQVRQGSIFLQHLAYSISKITQRWLAIYEKKPTEEELAKELDISESTIKYCLQTTSIQTLTIEENWVMFKTSHTNSEAGLPPIYALLSKLLYRVTKNNSEILLFEILDYLEKKQSLSIDTLNSLRAGINKA